MDNKPRCQSCGMPIAAAFGNCGTETDGSLSSDYCSFCYKSGSFVNPAQTLDEMIQSSIDNMTKELGMPIEKATELAGTFIPTLRRWSR